jgi:hypothetical protein
MVILTLMVGVPMLLYVYAVSVRNGWSWEDGIAGATRMAIGGIGFVVPRYWRWGYLPVFAVGVAFGALTGAITGAAALALAPESSFGFMHRVAGCAVLGGGAALVGAVGYANLDRVLDRLGGRA